MKLIYFIISFGLCFSTQIKSQIKFDKLGYIELTPFIRNISEFPEIYSSTPKNELQLIADSLQQVMMNDSTMSQEIQLPKNKEIYLVQSEDRKIRLLTWCSSVMPNGKSYYNHFIQYKLSLTKARCFKFNNDKRTYTELDNITDRNAVLIDSIYHLKKGIYLFQGISQESIYNLYAINIESGILRNAYIFHDAKKNKPRCSISANIDSKEYNINKIKCEIRNKQIKIPVASEENSFYGKYDTLYFNGSYFEDSVTYHNRLPDLDKYNELITRLYYKDADNKRVIISISNSQGFSLMIDIATLNKEPVYDVKNPYHVTLSNDEPSEHFQDSLFKVKIPLKPINGTVFIENVHPYHFPIISDEETKGDKLHSVIYTAGRDNAYPYEKLRYSAAMFNRNIEYEEAKQICWAIETDDNLQLLNGEEWEGPQIELQMKEDG